MQAIQLTLDQTLYRVDKDEIKEEKISDLVSYEDDKMRVMFFSGKTHYLIEKTATKIGANIFFTLSEAQKYQEKLRETIVRRAINALIRSSKSCTEIIQKYGKRQKGSPGGR